MQRIMQEALTRAFGVERLQTVLNGDDAMALGAAIRAAALNGQVGTVSTHMGYCEYSAPRSAPLRSTARWVL